MAELDALFDAIRAAASSAAWLRGVELVRAGAVSEDARSSDEIALHVATRGSLFTPKVLLFPARAEWDCDCGSSEDACLHACAAVIALRRAQGDEAPQRVPAAAAGKIAYRLQREADGLALTRVIVAGSEPRRRFARRSAHWRRAACRRRASSPAPPTSRSRACWCRGRRVGGAI